MANIFNGTPHVINIYGRDSVTFNAQQRKYILNGDELPIHIIDSGVPLNAKTVNAPNPDIDYGVPTVGAVQFVSYDELPEGYDLYIVSNLYRSAVQTLGGDTSRLATVTDTVYNESIKPCGCLALAVG